MKPLAPQTANFVEEARQRTPVAGDAIVGVVALKLAM